MLLASQSPLVSPYFSCPVQIVRRIEPYALWIGNAGDGSQPALLYETGIRCVVQLAYEERAAELPRDLIVVRVPLNDGAGNDPAALRLAISTVAELIEQKIPTLVCCGAGMSRSPAIVAMALSKIENHSAAACLERLTAQHAADVSTSLWADLMRL